MVLSVCSVRDMHRETAGGEAKWMKKPLPEEKSFATVFRLVAWRPASPEVRMRHTYWLGSRESADSQIEVIEKKGGEVVLLDEYRLHASLQNTEK